MSIYWQVWGDVPQDQKTVRSNTATVANDMPAAVVKQTPEFNRVDLDDNPDLGLVTRGVGGVVHESTKSRPEYLDSASHDYSHRVNSTISNSGHAAQLEEQGQFGHGSAMWTDSLERGIHDNSAFGNDYFTAVRRGINENSVSHDTEGTGVKSAVNYDTDARGRANAASRDASRQAGTAAYDYSWFLG